MWRIAASNARFFVVALFTVAVAVALAASYRRSDAIGWRSPQAEFGIRISRGQATIWHKYLNGAIYRDTGLTHARLASTLDPIARDFERTAERQFGPFAYYAALRTISTHLHLQAWPDTQEDKQRQGHPRQDIS